MLDLNFRISRMNFSPRIEMIKGAADPREIPDERILGFCQTLGNCPAQCVSSGIVIRDLFNILFLKHRI